MDHTEFNWQTSDGLQLYAGEWRPAAEACAVVALVHGLGEHCGRYRHVAQALNEAGYALLSFDLRGHGRSEGPRGHTPSLTALLDDIGLLLQQAEARFPGRPCFLYGHSLGGLLVLNYVLRRRPALRGAIVTGPPLRTPLEEQGFKVTLARLMNRLLPGLTMPSGLPVAALSRDAAVVQAYVSDPLVHDRVSTRLAVELLSAGRWALAHAAEFPPVPLLIMHGGADRICLPDGSSEFAARVPGECTLKIWEGLYHEVHNEPEQREVLAFLIAWLNGHLGGK